GCRSHGRGRRLQAAVAQPHEIVRFSDLPALQHDFDGSLPGGTSMAEANRRAGRLRDRMAERESLDVELIKRMARRVPAGHHQPPHGELAGKLADQAAERMADSADIV